MDKSDVAEMLFRSERIHDSKSVWNAVWDVVSRYVAPERATIYRQFRTPSEIQADVWDSTAIEAADRLVALMLSGLTPPWLKWFRLEPGDFIKDPEQRETLLPQLEIVRDGLLAVLGRSGFYEELSPVLLDRVVFGTGCIRLLEQGDEIRFKCIPMADFACDEDEGGKVNRVGTRRYWQLRDLKRVYGDKLPVSLRMIDENQEQDTSIGLPQHVVHEYEERQIDGTWECWTILKEDCTLLEHEASRYPRHYVTRWSKVPGSQYGRGPALRALSDIRSLNRLKELILKNAAKAVSGVYTAVDDGVLNPRTLSFAPGAIIPVASNSPNEPTLKELPNTAKFDIGQWSLESLQNSVKQAFMLDAFGDLSKTPRSATEVDERSEQLAQQLGASIVQLQHELIQPVLQHLLYVAGKRKLVATNLKLDQLGTRLDFVSSLATAQFNKDAQTLVQFNQLVAQAGQLDPRASFIIDIPESLRYLAQIQGVPAKLLRGSKEIDQLMQHAAQGQVRQDAQNQTLTPVPNQ